MNPEKRPKHEKPTPEHEDQYNADINKAKPETSKEIIEAIANSAKKHSKKKDP